MGQQAHFTNLEYIVEIGTYKKTATINLADLPISQTIQNSRCVITVTACSYILSEIRNYLVKHLYVDSKSLIPISLKEVIIRIIIIISAVALIKCHNIFLSSQTSKAITNQILLKFPKNVFEYCNGWNEQCKRSRVTMH